ncbi:MAG: tetratricopeptide repeat protein [Ignavibacteriaceae bacterium]
MKLKSAARNVISTAGRDSSVDDSFEMTGSKSHKFFGKKMLKFSVFIFIISISFSNLLLAQSADELINEGDSLVKSFNNQKALEKYLEADKILPSNWEVFWRVSRAYVDIAEDMPSETSTQEDAQLAKYQLAFNYADKAVKLAPNESITYLRRAIANGRIALFKGVFSVAGVVNKVKDDCEKAIKLGNGGNYFQALAHYVLGRTHAKVSEKWAPARSVLGLGWGDIDIAIEEYKKAIELKPNFRMFYLDLAKAYIREDEYDKAREMLNNVTESPKEDESDEDNLAEAKNLLEAIKDE